ncbi:MAG: TonB family protein [Pyrinomonadaceae bacterium]
MLENLVESKNNSRAVRKLYGFLFSTFLVVATILVSATIWSLFAKNFVMGNDDMSLSALNSPITVVEDIPKPEPEKQKQQNEPQTAKSELPNRQSNMAQVDEVQRVPDRVSTTPNTSKARPDTPFTVNKNAIESDGSFTGDNGRGNTKGGEIGFGKSDSQTTVVEITKPDIPKPPVLKKSEENIKTQPIVSLGVINGKATSLPKPPYPLPAKAVGASGAVNVQVTIDEEGNVVSAKAVSGHPLLREAAERAARSARFSPTYLSKVAVKVNGLIVYNFTR